MWNKRKKGKKNKKEVGSKPLTKLAVVIYSMKKKEIKSKAD